MKLFNNSFNNCHWKHLCQNLVLENCLLFGLNPRVTSKKINKYLLGTRETLEIFKLYEMRYLLLKIYPLIHILFQNPRVNSKFELKPSKTNLLPTQSYLFQKKQFPQTRGFFSFKHKNLPPQILFATITEAFSDIILKAATLCNMPCHKKRWINGSITAAISDIYSNDSWHYNQSLTHEQNFFYFNHYWNSNKENNEKIKEKITYYGRSRWPSLIVIPDIANNSMILSEVQKIGIPVIGLVNSHCTFEIDYPVFAQDQSFSSVYFFCHFLSTLIAKEMTYSQHKHYTLHNIQPQVTKKTNLFAQERKKTFSYRTTLFQKFVKKQKSKIYLQDSFFKKNIVPAQKNIAKRNWTPKWISRIKWERFRFFKKRERIHKKLGLQPYTFRVWRGFRKARRYFEKRRGVNSFWHRQLRKFFAYHTLRVEERGLGPADVIFKNENKKKYYLKQMQNFLLYREKKSLTNKLLRNFLWLSKKMPLYWKYRLSESTRALLANNNYYWWSLYNVTSDFKWQQHKYILPIFLNIKKKFLARKKHKKYKTNFVKPQKKQTWIKWVRKTKKNSPFKKKRFIKD